MWSPPEYPYYDEVTAEHLCLFLQQLLWSVQTTKADFLLLQASKRQLWKVRTNNTESNIQLCNPSLTDCLTFLPLEEINVTSSPKFMSLPRKSLPDSLHWLIKASCCYEVYGACQKWKMKGNKAKYNCTCPATYWWPVVQLWLFSAANHCASDLWSFMVPSVWRFV